MTLFALISPFGALNSRKAYLTAAAVGVFQLVAMGLYAAFPVFLGVLSGDESLGKPSQTTLSFAQSIVMIIVPVLGIVAGSATDKFGPNIVLFVSGAALLGVTLLVPLVESIEAFTAVYSILMGLCLAFITAPGPASIGSWFSEERVSIGVGIGEAGVALGTALMPLVAGLLVDHFNEWRPAFRWLAPCAGVTVLLSFVITQRRAEEPQEQQQQETEGERGEGEAAELTSALHHHLKSGAFIVIFASQFFFGLGYFSCIFCVAPFARAMGRNDTVYATATPISVSHASALYTFFGVASAFGALALGFLAAKLNTQLVLGVSCLVSSGAIAALIPSDMYWQLAALFSVLGAGFAGGLTCLPAMVMENFGGSPDVNLLMSISFLAFGVGGAIAPPAMSALYEHSSSNNQRMSYAYSFIVASVSLAVVFLVNCGVQLHKRMCNSGSGSVGDGDGETVGERSKLISS